MPFIEDTPVGDIYDDVVSWFKQMQELSIGTLKWGGQRYIFHNHTSLDVEILFYSADRLLGSSSVSLKPNEADFSVNCLEEDYEDYTSGEIDDLPLRLISIKRSDADLEGLAKSMKAMLLQFKLES